MIWMMEYEIVGIAVMFFSGGFATGFLFGKRYSDDDEEDIRRRVALFITLIWAISVLSTIIVPSYQTSIWIHAIMGGIVGYLFGMEDPVTGAFGGN